MIPRTAFTSREDQPVLVKIVRSVFLVACVRDGGWNVTLTDDMVLHGEYGGKEGKLVPAGASVVFGNYNILAERPNGQDQIVIHYESDTPIFANADGVTPFVCNLIHPQWEQGKARGVVFPENIIRNVLTFPPQLP